MAVVAEGDFGSCLCHNRLGHMSANGMKMLVAKRAYDVLKSVDMGVWGPSPVSSLGGSRFYVTFIDDSSKKVWVYFLKHKSDVFETFKKWKAEVEN